MRCWQKLRQSGEDAVNKMRTTSKLAERKGWECVTAPPEASRKTCATQGWFTLYSHYTHNWGVRQVSVLTLIWLWCWASSPTTMRGSTLTRTTTYLPSKTKGGDCRFQKQGSTPPQHQELLQVSRADSDLLIRAPLPSLLDSYTSHRKTKAVKNCQGLPQTVYAAIPSLPATHTVYTTIPSLSAIHTVYTTIHTLPTTQTVYAAILSLPATHTAYTAPWTLF